MIDRDRHDLAARARRTDAGRARSTCSASTRRPRSSRHRFRLDPDNVVRNPIKWTAVDRVRLEEQHLRRLDHGRRAEQVRPRDEEGDRCSRCRRTTRSSTASSRTGTTTSGWRCGTRATSRKFDTHNNEWTIFTPPTYPGQIRRLNVDAQNNIWFGIWSAGKRAGQAGKLDQTTGRITEYTIPRRNANPYDVIAGSRGQHLESPTSAAARRRSVQVQSARPDVHALSEAAEDGGHAEDSDHEGRRHLVFAARQPGCARRSACSIPTWTRSRRSARTT